MNAFITWLAGVTPGWKTQILAGTLTGAGMLLAILEQLQLVDLSAIIPPQYYPWAMMILGVTISILRMATTKAASAPKTVAAPSEA